MTDTKTGGSAFPLFDGSAHYGGMTLRDWFAGMALQGLCANSHVWEEMTENEMIEMAYRRAEKMISEGEK